MEHRLSTDSVLMEIAFIMSRRGTCSRLPVGVVFSRQGRVISTGYNGAPAGLPHCDHRNDIAGQGCSTAEHAERNAIAFAARHGVSLLRSEMHITHMPCKACAMSIINAGIDTVTYAHSYRLTDGIELLEAAGVTVVDFKL